MNCTVCGESAKRKYRILVEAHGESGMEEFDATTAFVPLCPRHRDEIIRKSHELIDQFDAKTAAK